MTNISEQEVIEALHKLVFAPNVQNGANKDESKDVKLLTNSNDVKSLGNEEGKMTSLVKRKELKTIYVRDDFDFILEIVRLKQQNRSLKKMIQKKGEERVEIEEKDAEIMDLYNQLADELEQQKKVNKKLRAKLDSYDIEKQKEVDYLRKEMEKMSNGYFAVEEIEKENQRIKLCISKLEQVNDDLVNKNKRLVEAKQQLQEEVHRLKEERDLLKGEILVESDALQRVAELEMLVARKDEALAKNEIGAVDLSYSPAKTFETLPPVLDLTPPSNKGSKKPIENVGRFDTLNTEQEYLSEGEQYSDYDLEQEEEGVENEPVQISQDDTFSSPQSFAIGLDLSERTSEMQTRLDFERVDAVNESFEQEQSTGLRSEKEQEAVKERYFTDRIEYINLRLDETFHDEEEELREEQEHNELVLEHERKAAAFDKLRKKVRFTNEEADARVELDPKEAERIKREKLIAEESDKQDRLLEEAENQGQFNEYSFGDGHNDIQRTIKKRNSDNVSWKGDASLGSLDMFIHSYVHADPNKVKITEFSSLREHLTSATFYSLLKVPHVGVDECILKQAFEKLKPTLKVTLEPKRRYYAEGFYIVLHEPLKSMYDQLLNNIHLLKTGFHANQVVVRHKKGGLFRKGKSKSSEVEEVTVSYKKKFIILDHEQNKLYIARTRTELKDLRLNRKELVIELKDIVFVSSSLNGSLQPMKVTVTNEPQSKLNSILEISTAQEHTYIDLQTIDLCSSISYTLNVVAGRS